MYESRPIIMMKRLLPYYVSRRPPLGVQSPSANEVRFGNSGDIATRQADIFEFAIAQ
jgi:hypothetical protein